MKLVQPVHLIHGHDVQIMPNWLSTQNYTDNLFVSYRVAKGPDSNLRPEFNGSVSFRAVMAAFSFV